MIAAGLIAALLCLGAVETEGDRFVASPDLPSEVNPREPAAPPEPRLIAENGYVWIGGRIVGMSGATSIRYQWPKAIRYEGKRDRTYVAYASQKSQPTLIFYDHALGYWSNPFQIAVSPNQNDYHLNPSLTIDREGFLYCFYGANKSEQRFRRSMMPENPIRWGLVTQPCELSTYPQAFFCGDTLYMFHRHGPGNTTWGVHTSSDGGETWPDYAPWFNFEFEEFWEGPEIVLYTEGESSPPRLHLAWIIYERKPNAWRDVYYAYTDDLGRSWRAADGSLLAGKPIAPPAPAGGSPWRMAADFAAAWAGAPPVPLERGDGELIYAGGSHGLVNDIAVDEAGRPALLFTTGGPKDLGGNAATSAYWDGSAWTVTRITPVTSRFCRGCLAVRGEGVLRALIPYGHRKGGDIHVWDSYDGGGAWRLTYNLTKDLPGFHRSPVRVINGSPSTQFVWSAGFGDRMAAKLYVWGEEDPT